MGERCKPIMEVFEALTHAVFGIVNIVMKLAPLGAFVRWRLRWGNSDCRRWGRC